MTDYRVNDSRGVVLIIRLPERSMKRAVRESYTDAKSLLASPSWFVLARMADSPYVCAVGSS